MTTTSPPPDDEEVGGLAGERTDLAWSRSGLAVAVCAAAVLKRVLASFEDVGPRVWVGGLLVAGAAAWVAALLQARTVAIASLAGRRLADPRLLRGVAVGTCALGFAAAALAFLPEG